jgi:hypothetical protein
LLSASSFWFWPYPRANPQLHADMQLCLLN